MDEIKAVESATVDLETWQPVGVTIHEGDPAGRGFTLYESDENGTRGTGVFECDPGKTTYTLEYNEIIYVLEGEVTIELENGSKVDLRAGMQAFLPAGHVSTWTFHTKFREVWVLAD
ncbi:cupin domain-containing protein [Nocardioides sp. SOB77]|uniref:Cupin domain-containing protein n=1 Tax=Nocardioides oceani TaxID=3058369 RepID=A0ABT8FCS0_9ACTN|nr:cupin domain-containing protein [Nocardioides oceani]MDN4172360.1 cupin domain-containing protein [Nocardioides oceani]